MPMKSFEGLNKEQLEAVQSLDRNTMVFAGPGTGKTRVITRRIAYLIEGSFLPPSRKILAITFTNKAANEMKSRVRELGIDARHIQLGTFHNFCLSVLRAYGDKIGLPRDFAFVSTTQRSALVRSVLKNHRNLTMNEFAFSNRISSLKNSSVDYNDYLTKTQSPVIGFTDATEEYGERLRGNKMIDFDDAILLTITLFKQFPKVLWLYHNAFPYLLVDEMQDTNRMQLELIRILGDEARNVMAVADDDQSIYGWRGALPTVIQEYIEKLDAISITLNRNYRSPQIILDAANALISHNSEREIKVLVGRETAESDCFEAYYFDTAIQEAEWVSEKIKEIHNEGIAYKDIIVLYRSRHPGLKIIDTVFAQKNVPFRHYGRNFNNKINLFSDLIKESLKLIPEPSNDLVLEMILSYFSRVHGYDESINYYNDFMPGGISVSGLSKITPEDGMDEAVKRYAQFLIGHNSSASYRKLFEALYDLLCIESSLENLDEEEAYEQSRHLEQLKDKMTKSQAKNVVDLIGELDLQDESNHIDDSINEVGVSTFHAAKGLEYKAVFIIALENDLVPAWNSDVAEERRGLYVAMTRSESKLFMTYAKQRENRNGSTDYNKQPSRFLMRYSDQVHA